MTIPFFEVKSSVPEPSLSHEGKLAREMGRPPWKVLPLSSRTPLHDVPLGPSAQALGVIFDPEFWYNHECWHKWHQALEKEGCGHMINVPLGNQNPAWQNNLNIPPYTTLRGLEETARFRAPCTWKTARLERIEELSVAVFPRSMWKEFPRNQPLGWLPHMLLEQGPLLRLFCSGWLHAFNVLRQAGRRDDLLAMCSWDGSLVLELGCGEGLMAEACKQSGAEVTWVGLDCDPERLKRCNDKVDLALKADGRSLPFATGQTFFKRIVCADFLEHVASPWEVLQSLRGLIHNQGLLIASFPNVGHWTVVEDLLAGRFDETPSGIMCVGHLRFGTWQSWKGWFEKSGWHIGHCERECLAPPEHWSLLSRCETFQCDEQSLATLRYRVVAHPI